MTVCDKRQAHTPGSCPSIWRVPRSSVPPLVPHAPPLGALLRQYSAGSALACDPVDQGLLNRGYRLATTRGDYFLKHHFDPETADPAAIARQHRATQRLADLGVPVAPPLPGRDGRTVAVVGGHAYALHPWIDGRHRHGGQLSTVQCGRLGALLGVVHASLERVMPTRGRAPGERVGGEREGAATGRGQDAPQGVAAHQGGTAGRHVAAGAGRVTGQGGVARRGAAGRRGEPGQQGGSGRQGEPTRQAGPADRSRDTTADGDSAIPANASAPAGPDGSWDHPHRLRAPNSPRASAGQPQPAGPDSPTEPLYAPSSAPWADPSDAPANIPLPTTTASADPADTFALIDDLLAHVRRHRPTDDFDELARYRLLERRALLEQHADRRPPPGGSVGWVHGDFHPFNLLYKGDAPAAIVDWDRLGVQPRAEEAVRAAAIFFVRPAGTLDLPKARAYARAYRRTAGATPSELAAAVHRVWWERLNDFWMLRWHYERGDTRADSQFPAASALAVWWTREYDAVCGAFAD
ncbi:phosphotransferase [Streptomyces sp. ADMS]|nr:phosphotransferase [Streptomyces sp. ADMS]MDW4904739.1 phosphotransferase [Streptomyces sp. ADMS]